LDLSVGSAGDKPLEAPSPPKDLEELGLQHSVEEVPAKMCTPELIEVSAYFTVLLVVLEG
jgi:hypothetical protein